jgi:hypothetical protein
VIAPHHDRCAATGMPSATERSESPSLLLILGQFPCKEAACENLVVLQRSTAMHTITLKEPQAATGQ